LSFIKSEIVNKMCKTKIKNLLSFFILILISVFQMNCNDSTVINQVLEAPLPGRRDYVWTVDTLSKINSSNNYNILCGTSPQNVWCFSDNGDAGARMLHFDGKTLSSVSANVPVKAAFGLSSDEIWLADNNNAIWLYKGGQLRKAADLTLPGYGKVYINDIWGEKNGGLFAAGSAETINHDSLLAVILRYDGDCWKYVVKPSENVQFMGVRTGINTGGNLYLKAYKTGKSAEDSSGFYECNGEKLKRLYLGKGAPYNEAGILLAGNELYFAFNNKIHSLQNGEFIPVVNLNGYALYSTGYLYGRSIKDFFVFMNDGVGHYNGTDLQTIYKADWGLGFLGGAVFDNEVFFLCSDVKGISYLLHGKLK